MIETLTNEELWEELQKRYLNCVLIYEREKQGDKNTICNNYQWSGSRANVRGLLEWALQYERHITIEEIKKVQ